MRSRIVPIVVFGLIVSLLTGCGGGSKGGRDEVTNREPVITSVTPLGGKVNARVNEEMTFTVVASDPDEDELSFAWKYDDVPISGANSNSYILLPEAAGQCVLSVVVSDGKATVSHAWTLTIVPEDANHAPTITTVTPASLEDNKITATTGHTINFSVTANDKDDDPLFYEWECTNGEFTIDSDLSSPTVTWKAPQLTELAEVTVTVHDGDQETSYTWEVTVNPEEINFMVISSPLTLKGDCVYVVNGSPWVQSTLTIEPGAIIKFRTPSSGLTIKEDGSINAVGTSDKPIIFTSFNDDNHGGDTNNDGSLSSPAPGDWDKIALNPGELRLFNYCNFYYGGGNSQSYPSVVRVIPGDNEVWVPVTVTDCIFAHNIDGLDAYGAAEGSTIAKNSFYANDGIPLIINTNVDIDDSNLFTGFSEGENAKNGIWVASWLIDAPRRWEETEVPFVIDRISNVTVKTTGSLYLGDNVALKFGKDKTLFQNDNIFNYDGPGVVFTSLKDDTVKGDTNGDNYSTGEIGDWKAITKEGEYGTYKNYKTWPNIFYDSYAHPAREN